MPDAILQLTDVKTHFPISSGFIFRRHVGTVKAVDGVTLSVQRGEVLGLVGESGCGKSTLARTIMQLVPTTAGAVVLQGKNLAAASAGELLAARRDMQMVFQDPYASLNPRMTVYATLAEPLLVHRVCAPADVPARVAELMRTVGLAPRFIQKYPHEFSGGQRQRIGIARALALNPKLVIADEPVSALDVSVRSQVLNLLLRLQRERGLTYIFISHDLSVVEHISDSVAIMYLGRIVEKGPTERIFATPAHPYTRALIAAIPVADPAQRKETAILKGEAPSPISPPPGCPFHPRCHYAIEACRTVVPPLEPVGISTNHPSPDHIAACIRKDEI